MALYAQYLCFYGSDCPCKRWDYPCACGAYFSTGEKVQTFFKASLYLPTVASGVTMALVWFWIYDPTNMGLLNMILNYIGIENTMWLGSRSTALFSLILMSWLTGHGAGIILYLAALVGFRSLYMRRRISIMLAVGLSLSILQCRF